MQQPLFILSPPRSFTTITCAMLGCHPQMFGLAETNLFFADSVRELNRLYILRPTGRHGLLRSVAELGFQEQSEETIEAAKAWLDDNGDTSTGELFSLLAGWAPDRTLIDKSPLHVFRLDWLKRMLANFPDAHFLHLTRHPYTMGKSLKSLREKFASDRGKMSDHLRHNDAERETTLGKGPDGYWLRPHLTILEFLEEVPPKQQMRLRGEDLLSDPPKYLAQICDWLGKSKSQAAIDAMLHPERSPFAKYGPSNAMYGNDPNYMEKPELRPYTEKLPPIEDGDRAEDGTHYSPTLRSYAEVFGY